MLSAYTSEHLWTDAPEVWKLLFEVHLILDIKTTIKLQKASLQNLLMEKHLKWKLQVLCR